MPLMSWKDDYSAGVAEIDQQHKKMIDLINQLDAAMCKGEDGLVLEPLTNFAFSNCPYSHKGKNKGSDNYVCDCPVRKDI